MAKNIDNRVYYQVSGWMINDLHLTGQELICYAIIYSLSQLGQGWYNAGLEYLSTFMQCSQPTASKALKGLREKGLIEKEEVITDYGRRVLYYCTNPDERGDAKDSFRGVNKNFMDGVNKNFMHNNINNKENKDRNKSVSNDTPKVTEFEEFYKLYPLKKSKAPAEKSWNKLSEKDRQAAIQSLPAYISDCALNKRSFKHPSTFLNQRTWEDEFGVKPSIAFYDPIDGEDEQKTRFKRWMRANFPEIENTALPLSFEDYMQLIQGENVENVTNALTEINREIYKYRKSDIAQVVRAMLPNEEEEDYD